MNYGLSVKQSVYSVMDFSRTNNNSQVVYFLLKLKLFLLIFTQHSGENLEHSDRSQLNTLFVLMKDHAQPKAISKHIIQKPLLTSQVSMYVRQPGICDADW